MWSRPSGCGIISNAGEEKYRPTLIDLTGKSAKRQFWLLDGENLGPKFPSPNEKQSEEHLKKIRPRSRHAGCKLANFPT